MVRPEIGQNKRPDADEEVDEDLHRGRRGENPARLITHAFGQGLGIDQGFGDAARRDRGAICLDREADPGRGDKRVRPKEMLGEERQDQNFDDGEDHHQRRDDDRHPAGRERIAPPVAIAAATPQTEMPDAKGAAHSREKPNHLRATK